MQRVCVIGSGPAGLFTLKALKALDQSTCNVICFEQRANIGGIWDLNDDQYSSMYYGLFINNPKELMELPFYRFPKDLPSYPGREAVLKCVREFAERENLEKYIKFGCKVEVVSFNKTSKTFTVKYSVNSESEEVAEFDYVIVATGYFSKPRGMSFPGHERFSGQIIHSSRFRRAEEYKGKRVLLIGGSFSGQDIALKLVDAKASKVTVSTAQASEYPYTLPGVSIKPAVEMIESSSVTFEDGSSEVLDCIINCCGYEVDFPFLHQSLQPLIKDSYCYLYQRVVLPENNNLFFIGMQKGLYTVPMFYLQADFAARVISAEISLPPSDIQREVIERDCQKAKLITDVYDAIDYMTDYMNSLGVITGVQLPDMKDLWIQWENDRRENIVTYREHNFESLY